MKRWLLLIYAVIALGLTVVAIQNTGGPTKKPKSPESGAGSAHPAVLGVEALMQDVDSYRTATIVVAGVVSGRDFGNQVLTLIDEQEFQKYGVTTNSVATLLIRWSGTMPLEQEAVRVKGEIQELDGKLFSVAQTLEKVTLKQGSGM